MKRGYYVAARVAIGTVLRLPVFILLQGIAVDFVVFYCCSHDLDKDTVHLE